LPREISFKGTVQTLEAFRDKITFKAKKKLSELSAIPGYPGNAIIVQFLQIAFVNFYKQSFGKSLVIMKFQHLS
jgi:hypothetical protein